MPFSDNIFSLISVTLGKKSVTQLAICYFHVPSMEKSVTKSTTEHLFIWCYFYVSCFKTFWNKLTCNQLLFGLCSNFTLFQSLEYGNCYTFQDSSYITKRSGPLLGLYFHYFMLVCSKFSGLLWTIPFKFGEIFIGQPGLLTWKYQAPKGYCLKKINQL